MPQAQASFKIDGIDDVIRNVEDIRQRVSELVGQNISQFCSKVAEDVKKEYTGDGKGFHDRTGALRRSIVGGLESQTPNEIIGFVSAGDDRIGFKGKATRDYVLFIEFPEFRRNANADTSFLRSGVLMNGMVHKGFVENVKRTIFEAIGDVKNPIMGTA